MSERKSFKIKGQYRDKVRRFWGRVSKKRKKYIIGKMREDVPTMRIEDMMMVYYYSEKDGKVDERIKRRIKLFAKRYPKNRLDDLESSWITYTKKDRRSE